MATKVEIINRALIEMGMDPITSIDDSTAAARTMRTLWDMSRDATLCLSNWGFAGAVTKIASTPGETNDYRYSKIFPLPHDFLKLRGTLLTEHYRLTGDTIFADAGSPLTICYTQRVEEVNRWPVLVQEVLSAKLAVSSALKLTGHRSTRAVMEDWLKAQLMEARHVHSAEHEQDVFQSDEWLAARR